MPSLLETPSKINLSEKHPAPCNLTDLAARINEAHRQAEAFAQNAVQRAVDAGTLLLAAKEAVPHGEWLPWLAANCELSERTAQVYMRIARELPKLDPAKSAAVADLPLREAARLISQPRVEKAWFESGASLDVVTEEICEEFSTLCDMHKHTVATFGTDQFHVAMSKEQRQRDSVFEQSRVFLSRQEGDFDKYLDGSSSLEESLRRMVCIERAMSKLHASAWKYKFAVECTVGRLTTELMAAECEVSA